jgi:diguanylate cyclase (GGDEF)-like protein
MTEVKTSIGAALVAVGNRADRRLLFDALDGQQFDVVYTAKDLAQARNFLQNDHSVRLVVVDFGQAALEGMAVLQCLEVLPNAASVRLFAVGTNVVDDRPQLPHWYAQSAVWLTSPVNIEQVRLQLTSLLATDETLRMPEKALSRPVAKTVVPTKSSTNQELAWLQLLPMPSLILDKNTRHIVAANNQILDALQEVSADVLARPVEFFFQLKERDRGKQVGPIRVSANKQSFVLVTHLFQQAGQWLELWQLQPEVTLGEMPIVLQELASALEFGLDADERALRLERLRNALSLDLLLMMLDESEGEGGPRLLFCSHQAASQEILAKFGKERLYDQVLSGNQVIFWEQASQKSNSELVAQFGLQSAFAMPITDDRGRAFGIMLAGKRAAFSTKAPTFLAGLQILSQYIGADQTMARLRRDTRFQGLHDSLTRLPNRLLFTDRLESAIAEAQRSGEMFALLFVDLDRFKSINDSLGHSFGDQVLLAVSRKLKVSVRASDTVARYAGDEFTVLLRRISSRADVFHIAETIIKVLESPLTLADGHELHTSASIGISFYPEDGTNAEDLLKRADMAMYTAKSMGRNTYKTFQAENNESHQQRLALESKLRLAERNRELRLYYQPQIDAATEAIIGMEALIRWEHPELGMISPGFFIPLAEDTGLIIPIGEWVLRNACFETKRWQNNFDLPLRVSVNLSAVQLRQENLLDIVRSALKEADLDPASLDLEITESINIREIAGLMETLDAIRSLGCGIAIDDFGTGQSSLDYIKRFPANRIKIDQTFIRNVGIDPDDEAIIRATINMAQNLGRNTVAEGVETEEIATFLRDLGCEELQGFLFSRPLSVPAFEQMLEQRRRLLSGLTNAV